MGCYYGFVNEDFPNALKALDEALKIASEEKDYITLVLVGLWSGVFHSLDCDFEKAKNSLQLGVDINTAAKSLWGIASQQAQLAYFCYYQAGQINSLTEVSSEALKIAEQSGDPISRGISHTVYGLSRFCQGSLEDAEIHCFKGRDLCESIGFYAWAGNAWFFLAEIYFEKEDYHKSRYCFSQGIRNYEAAKSLPSWRGWAQLAMARCGVMRGERDANLEQLRAIAEKNRIKSAKGLNCRFLGEILMNLGGSYVAEAEQWTEKAIEADSMNGMQFSLGLDHALYGEFFKRQGRQEQAHKELGKAIEILMVCGADGWVKKYEAEMAKLA